jgi:dihydrolipoamide dehydrogenase
VNWDVIVIGTGPGGYHAAIRAAQLRLKVLAIEAEAIGGVCLNVGCIPTKALLHAASEIDRADQAAAFGLSLERTDMDMAVLGRWRDGVRDRLTGGVTQLLKSNGVEVRRGNARLAERGAVFVDDERLTAPAIILATGSEPVALPDLVFDGQRVIDSTAALALERGVPDSLLVVGGGAVGLEFASIYNRFGARVTLIEGEDQILPGADPQVVAELQRSLVAQGIDIRPGTRADDITVDEHAVKGFLTSSRDSSRDEFRVDRLLAAVGRRPRTQDLGLAEAGVDIDAHGFIRVNDHMQTGVDGIYAVGDCTGAPLLAHKAMKQGLVAAANAAGQDAVFDYQVARIVYTDPEWAAVGMTEAQAQERGIRTVTGVFPLAASGRALTLGGATGMIKLVGDAGNDLLLGADIVAPGASELINEVTLALEMAATLTDVAATVHAHPTLAEGIMEAAEHSHGQAIHIGN